MKILIFKIGMCLFLGLILGFNSCEHDSLLDQACGIKNPSKNISWLRNLITDINTNQSQDLQSIEIRNFNSQEIIIITWKLIGIQDAPTGSIYNCEGDLLYYCGGNQPVDSCSYVLSNSQLIGYIWTKK
jgi:hypothetical protein